MVKRSLVYIITGAVTLAMIPIIQRMVFLPLYLEASHQREMALVNRVSAVILLPGKSLVYKISPPTGHYFTTPGLLAASAINLVIYGLLGILLWRFLCRRVTHIPATKTFAVNAGEAPASPQRRDFLMKSATGGIGLFAISTAGYPVLVRPGWLTVRRVNVPIQNLPPSLNGLTIAQLTDFHHDEWISIEHVRSAVQLANSLNPDIVALTGDYVTSKGALIAPAMAELARLTPRIATVGVMGNHDWWADVKETRKQAAAQNIPLLDNDRLFITPDRRLSQEETSGLCLAGVGDLWEDVIDPEKAFSGVDAAMPRILLSHNPDVAEQGSIGHGYVRVDLMLSGHTHGGQVRLPIIGAPIVPSAYGQKYAQGLVQGPACPVQISAGLGMAILPVRIGVPPEIVLIRLTSKSN